MNEIPKVNLPDVASTNEQINLATAMNKLDMVLENVISNKKSEKEDDDIKYEESLKRKAWRDLDANTKWCILNGSTKFAKVSPKQDPCDSLLSIISEKSSARVTTHLYFALGHKDIIIAPGLITVLSRGIILSIPTAKDISNLSVVFVPPKSTSIMNAEHFLKLHLLEKEGKGYDAEDVKNATIQTPS